MNNSGIIKTLDKGNGKMKTWELVNEYVDDLNRKLEVENPNYKWPSMCGALQAELGNIMIQLSVYHPEAFEMVVQKNFKHLIAV